MRKILFSLLVILLGVSSANGQLKVDFAGGTASPGGTIDVDVVVSDFEDIFSLQFSVNWDPTVFSYNSIQNVTDVLEQFSEAGNIATPEALVPDPGELTVSWSHSSTNEFSIPDNTRLFTLRLNAIGSACDETKLIVTDEPRDIEVVKIVNGDFEFIGVAATGGDVDIEGTNCNGGGGGTDCTDTCASSSDFSLIGSCEEGRGGDNVCMTVTGRNISDIASITTGVVWNPNVLRYTGVNNKEITVALNENETSNGRLRVLWSFTENPLTVNDNTELFDICFDLVGSRGQESDIEFVDLTDVGFFVEVTDFASGANQDVCLSKGQIKVTDGDGGGNTDCMNTCSDSNDFSLIASCETVESDEQSCVTYTTRNFTDITAFQTGISWNNSVVNFSEIREKALTGIAINEADASQGRMRLSWLASLSQVMVTLDDDTELFDLCFDIVGNDGQASDIEFIDIPDLNFDIEIADADGNALPFCVSKGQIKVEDDGGGGGTPLTLTAGNITGNMGEEACMNIRVSGFEDIQSAQFTLEWDASVLTYTRLANIELPEFGNTNVNFISPNKLRVTWSPISVATLADNSNLFQVCFDVIGQCGNNTSSNVRFISDGPIDIEFSNSSNEELIPTLNAGSITVGECQNTCALELRSNIENNTCQTGGGIELTLTGANGRANYDWDNGLPNRATHSNLNGGTYCVTITDEAGCSINRCYDVEEYFFDIQAFVEDATCDTKGSITVDATSLNTSLNFRYNWDSGLPSNTAQTNLDPGQYCVTVTEPISGCERERCYTVRQDSDLSVDAEVTDVTNSEGNNGSITLNVTSTSTLSYAWSNDDTTKDISGLSPGTYTVSITGDGDCEVVRSYEVEWNAIFTDGITAENNGSVTCMGESDGTISGEITGGCGGNRVFLDGDEVQLPIGNLGVGTYTIRVEDNCGNSDETTITISDPDLISVSSTIECSFDGQSIGSILLDITGGSGTYTTDWSRGVADGNNITEVGTGDISVLISDSNGCEIFEEFEIPICENVLGCDKVRNVISPNGDEVNDQFVIGCLIGGSSQFQPNELGIFDRWGRQVFGATNYDNTWAGTDMNGDKLNEGGYMWVLKVDTPGEPRQVYRGTLTLLRTDF